MKRALVLAAAYLVLGGSAVEADDPRAAQLTYQPWTKFCISKSNCFVGASAQGLCSPSGGTVTIALPENASASLSVIFGTRQTLDGAISFQIDQDNPIVIPDRHCYPSGCGGKFEIDRELVERLKRSQTIVVEATNSAHRKISLSFSLAGFAAAFDGPGAEPKSFEMSQEQFKELLRRRGEPNQPLPQCED
jgi:invasion protein IalB